MLKFLKNIFSKNSKKQINLQFELENGKLYEEFVNEDDYENRKAELNEIFKNQNTKNRTIFIWCLIGNIIGEHFHGENKEIKFGTKHFSPKTKVYCFQVSWGDGYENIKVIGRHRKTDKKVKIIVNSRYITNWRLQKVFNPFILNLMFLDNGWTDCEKDKSTILEMLKCLPSRTMKSES